jgi:hypothetical protein
MKQVKALALSLMLATSVLAAPAPQATTAKKAATKTSTGVSKDLQELKQALEAQQQQLQQLRQDVRSRDQKIQELEQRLDQSQAAATQAQSKADTAASQATQQQQDVSALKSDVTDLKANATNTALTIQEEQKKVSEAIGSPLAIHFKGITITPGGFIAAETVWRQRGLASDVNTPFNSVPFPGAQQSHVGEFFGSGRQSRLSFLGEGKLKSAKLSAYYEADFLSSGITSNNNQSNSYSLRQRQVWGQAAFDNGLSFTAGQMWSLVTETKKAMDNRTEALPMTIDAQYNVGFTWARQYGFRVTKNFQNKVWLGFAVENPQTTFAAHGANNNFVLGAAGTGGGLYNSTANYSFNATPDIVAKAVIEPGWGHFEVFGIFSQFRDRIFPCWAASAAAPCGGLTTPSAANAFNDKRTGGGVGVNARGSLYQKHIDVGIHLAAGDGIGRYGSGGLPDATVRPDGTLALIKSYQGLGTLELHYPKVDIYTNYGIEFAGRTSYLNGTSGEGYGSMLFNNAGCSTEPLPSSTGSGGGFNPGSLSGCTGDTHNVEEGTVGFWYKIYNGPKGRVQFGPQYSYVYRTTWSGALGVTPKGKDNIILTSFRYYLP